MNSCDFAETSPAIIPDSELTGYYTVDLGRRTITAGVAISMEGVSLVYLAYSGAIAVVNCSVTQARRQGGCVGCVRTRPVCTVCPHASLVNQTVHAQANPFLPSPFRSRIHVHRIRSGSQTTHMLTVLRGYVNQA